MSVDRADIYLDGRLQEIISNTECATIFDWQKYLENQKLKFQNKINDSANIKTEKHVSSADLTFIKLIGTGAFGKVLMAKHNTTNEMFAVKILDKLILRKQKKWVHAMNEKKLLLSIQCPFAVKIFAYYEDKRKLGLVLELVPGGDLSFHLYNMGRFDEYLSKFYAAQILLAIEYLHYVDVVYRDIKPENILLDVKGYIKLTDFGLSKQLKNGDRTYTICGTPEYIAPEVIESKGYGRSVDFWSFGVLLYEFNSGATPFFAKTHVATYTKITNCSYKIPKYFSHDLKDMVLRLLQKDLSKRYGVLKGGIDDIKEHKWFQNITWLGLVNKVIQAPYIPKTTNPTDSGSSGR